MNFLRPNRRFFEARLWQGVVVGFALAHAPMVYAFEDFAANDGLAAIDVGRVPGNAPRKAKPAAAKAAVATHGETLASVFSESKKTAAQTLPPVASEPHATRRQPQQVTITLDGKNATLHPATLSFDAIGATAQVLIHVAAGSKPEDAEGLNIFVRDQASLLWNPDTRTLAAAREGETELYLVWQGKMVIVPVAVKKQTTKATIDVPQSLVSLGNILDKSTAAPHASFADSTPSRKAALSVRASTEEAEETLQRQEVDSRRYHYEVEDPRFRTLVMQVIDERSIPESGLIYPVHDAQVRISGTDFYAASDATGLVSIGDVPVGGRILAQVYDREGQFQPTVQEIFVDADEKQEVVRVRLLQRSMFDVYTRVNQVAQDGRLASLCGRAMVKENGERPLGGAKVALNVEADGPYYFNRYGPDPYARTTDEFGRFCFFNVRPGLAELTLYENESLAGALTVPVFGGRHLEDDFVFANAPAWSTRLAVAAPAMDQLFEASQRADRYESHDSADMTLVGENEAMERLESGVMASGNGASVYRERAYALSQGAEFEPTIYAYDMGEDELVTPLFPRGFVEDVFRELYLQDNQSSIAFDPSLGSIVVHTGLRNGMSADDVTIKLLDGYGREIEGGWYFGSDTKDVVKAMFFNVPPGVYTVLAETKGRHWLDVTTVAVDYWTLSYARLGTKLRYSQ